MGTIPTEWYPWPMEQTLSRGAMCHVERTLREGLDNVAEPEYRDELENCANHIRAWLERQPVPKDTLLL